MKQFTLLLFLLSLAAQSFGQNVFIPDSVFRVFLQANYPNCMNGDSLDSQCPEVVNEDVLMLDSLPMLDPTGIEFFVNLDSLDCSYNYITWLPALPTGLVYLYCRKSELQELPEIPLTLTFLDVVLTDIDTLPSLPITLEHLNNFWGATVITNIPDSLVYLNLGYNGLTEAPNLPVGLEYLSLSYNDITEIPVLPSGLLKFICHNNDNLNYIAQWPSQLEYINCGDCENLGAIPSLPLTLTYLRCNDISMTEMPELPSGLETLRCDYNSLVTLPELPATLKYLNCWGNELISLPELPDSLEQLIAHRNHLTEIPELPDQLTILSVGDNELETIPVLPPLLISLGVDQNQLTVLPDLPQSLWFLSCWDNFLVSLPQLGDSLEYLYTQENHLEFLPALPPTLIQLRAYSNLLNCLPILPGNLYVLDIYDNPLTCLPNIPVGVDTIGMNLPVCTVSQMHYCDYVADLTGTVFYDQNQNCLLDSAEIGLRGRVVERDNGFYAISDSLGRYHIYSDTGFHFVNQLQQIAYWGIDCPGIPYEVQVDTATELISDLDFPNYAPEDCHWLWIDAAASIHRPCFATNSVNIQYCNLGTEAVSNAYSVIALPEELWLVDATIPWQNLGEGYYLFQLGDLAIDECGSFSIVDSVACEAEVGSTICLKAIALPLSLCNIGGLNWDYSSVAVSASCIADTMVEFVIKNIGQQAMASPSQYRVYQNNGLLVPDQPFQLSAGDSIVVSMASSGETYRLEADQVLDHPGNSNPRAIVEGCGNPTVLGLVTQTFFDDLDDFVDIECEVLRAAYDPNDKQVVPSGIGPNHIVSPDNQMLEYKIRFQNTGTDTAFNIEVVDTLPAAFVNPATFQSGASSNPYSVTMHGNGIVAWQFENILLPDSNINEPASHGFVKFKIRQRPNLTNGTIISNSAAIYFDYNSPIITNSAFITISDTVFWAEAVSIAEYSPVNISVQPNPFTDVCIISVDRPVNDGVLQMLDAMGRVVYSESISGQRITINGQSLQNGIYTVRILDNGTPLGVTRVSLLR